MKTLIAAFLALACAALPAPAAAAPERVQSVEGVTEYRLPNGLRVLTLPDPGTDTVTVHIVYLVGSRHEGYGEKGMAHLLEHMLFKGSTRHPSVKEEFTHRGARWNGTTSDDRTTYFETLPAGGDNLEWAIGMEADRMVNSFVRRSDLDAEMTVVRNEFEMGENSPGGVLFQRMQQLAFPWHNYGKPVIGQRADIERVPIEKLQAFYRTWYQPDNAVLILAGRFDEAAALGLVERYFGRIPRPARALPDLYTVEPVQDGEREVTLRRAGDVRMVSTLYRVAAGSDPTYPAIDVLVQVIGDVPGGRLHRALVQKGLASAAWGYERSMHDPGYVQFGARLDRTASIAPARDALISTVEGIRTDPIRADEVERARTQLLNDMDKAQQDTGALVRALSESQAIGDWRLFFAYRERLRRVTLADVRAAAERYLKPANRVLGVFEPTDKPDRAQIPPTPDVSTILADVRDGARVRLGEAFDPSPANIEARVVRRRLANGIRVALLPKRTRGGRAVAELTLHWGDEASLTGRDVACEFAGGMLSRGSTRHTRAELKDALDRLNASVSAGGGGAALEARGEDLVAALRLAAEMLRQPAFPPSEFEEMKREALTGAESRRGDPAAVAGVELARALQAYPSGHPNYTPTIDERLDWLRRTTLQDAQSCYRDLFGATGADFVAVGDFDPDAVARAVEELFGDWRNPRPFARVPSRYFDRPGLEAVRRTPDKANAVLRAGFDLRMRDDDPDFPAMILANYLLGGSASARLPARVREKEGLSYSTSSGFSASPLDELASFRVNAIFAPQNRARVEAAIGEELSRAAREGFGEAEVESGKKALLEARRLARTQDRALAGRLSLYVYLGRTFAWDTAFEARIASLTPAEVNAAVRRRFDPARLAKFFAGDFPPP